MTCAPHPTSPDEAGRAIRGALAACRPGASICPTDAARHLAAARGETAPDAWRHHLATIRRTALDLAREGSIVILRKGKVVEPDAARGVIRLAQPAIPPGETA